MRRNITKPPSNRLRTAKVYGHFFWKADCITTSNRADALHLAHLWSGHKAILKAHLLHPAADNSRPLCKEEPQALEHWLQRCPHLDVIQQRTFGSPSSPLRVPTADFKVLEFVRPPSRILGARLNDNNNKKTIQAVASLLTPFRNFCINFFVKSVLSNYPICSLGSKDEPFKIELISVLVLTKRIECHDFAYTPTRIVKRKRSTTVKRKIIKLSAAFEQASLSLIIIFVRTYNLPELLIRCSIRC